MFIEFIDDLADVCIYLIEVDSLKVMYHLIRRIEAMERALLPENSNLSLH